ncbi:hypothetical protein BH20ACT2_BH20ACT2_13360 [soil metagenome]
MRCPLALLALLALQGLLLGCATDPRELAETDRTMPPSTPTTAPDPGDGVAPGAGSITEEGATEQLTLTSPAFAAGAPIPAAHACDGAATSPPLAWSGVPESAIELAVVVVDPDAGGFAHWVIAGIDPATTGIAAGAVPAGAVEATNDTGGIGWAPPCPPPADGPHTYELTLYALDRSPAIAPGGSPTPAIAAIEASALGRDLLMGTHDR